MNFIDSLVENDSIILDKEVSDWEKAIQEAVNPLIRTNAVTQQYVQEIIDSTKELGPYYILLPNFAMPHARPGDYVKKDSFSLLTLKEPVYFPEKQPVKIIVCLAATSSDAHLESALPQIATIFSDEQVIEKIYQAKTKDYILNILKKENE